MKKLIALLLASVIVLSFCGCESGPSSEEINAAGLIIDNLDAVFNIHHNANEDVLIANTVSASSGCATRMSNLTSQLKYMSHDDFVEALASVVALVAEEQGNDDPDAIYEWCVTMEDPSDMFYIFNESYVPKACGMAIQGHAFALSGTDDKLEKAKNDLDAFSKEYPDSEILPALEVYCDAINAYSDYCQSAFVITDAVSAEIEILESSCVLARDSLGNFII
ncbi:MAG: hypothetical protein IJM98_09775 [Oscillospiraceae bacterium]|nr:hypothetical protein [Oscillospiraceae bacterium]MBQ3560301.1 hypothetical protein [Oscillospiraceae bacterium]MBQ4118710.1 hypothetical protein [Oscillospiraceae bacterium]MBQ6700931.1 hypothetical protein [Oscillospiraceae bacterium]